MQESHLIFVTEGINKVLNTNNMKVRQDAWFLCLSSFPRCYDTEFLILKVHFHGNWIGTSCTWLHARRQSYLRLSYHLLNVDVL